VSLIGEIKSGPKVENSYKQQFLDLFRPSEGLYSAPQKRHHNQNKIQTGTIILC
jgi:hypothetical protein